MELGSRPWLQAVMGAVNASAEYRDRAAGWRWPLALGFLDPGDHAHDRYVVLDLCDGECHGATVTDRHGFEQSPFRLAAPYGQWERLIHGRLDAMRCLLLGQAQLEGDRLTAVRYLPAAKAMLDAMGTVDADLPVG